MVVFLRFGGMGFLLGDGLIGTTPEKWVQLSPLGALKQGTWASFFHEVSSDFIWFPGILDWRFMATWDFGIYPAKIMVSWDISWEYFMGICYLIYKQVSWNMATQMLHVWNIYLHLPQKWPNVGKYCIHGASGLYHGFQRAIMEIHGDISWYNESSQTIATLLCHCKN